MALKITSGAWITANRENREQRNMNRTKMFEEAGVQPAKSLRDVHIPAPDRLESARVLFIDAAGSRIKDDNLAAIAAHMKAALETSGLSAPSAVPTTELQSLGILGFSPEVMTAFFNVDHDTSLELSMTADAHGG